MRVLVTFCLAGALGTPLAFPQGTWSVPVPVGVVNSTTQDYYVHISGDGLILRVSSSRTDIPGRVGGWDIYYALRAARHSPWSSLRVEPGINSLSNDLSPHILSGEQVAYIASLRPGTGGADIWRFTRSGLGTAWGNATEVKAANTRGTEYGVSVTDDDLYMALWSSSGYYVELTRTSPTSPWGNRKSIAVLNNFGTAALSRDTRVSPDGLTMYFAAYKPPGGVGGHDICVTHRAFRSDPWGKPMVVPNVNSMATDRVPSISPDGRELYFTSNRTGGTGGQDVYVSYFTGLSYQGLPRIGRVVLLHVTHRKKPGESYQIGLALSNNVGIPVPGVGRIPLDLDPLLVLIVTNALPLTRGFNGRLDGFGEATGQLLIPGDPALVGMAFHAAAVLYNRSGISYITNGLRLGIHR